jgi:hypothetical protein
LDVEKLTTRTLGGAMPSTGVAPMDFTSIEVQDWFELEDSLLDQFQQREDEVEQQRRTKVWLRSDMVHQGE